MDSFQIADPVVKTYVLILNTSDILSRYAEVQLSKLNITPTQYMVLMTLSAVNQPPTLTELSQRLFRALARRNALNLQSPAYASMVLLSTQKKESFMDELKTTFVKIGIMQ